MKTLLPAIMFAAFLVPSLAQAQDPSLIAVTVRFELPKCDDKDDDSSFDIAITSGSTLIAEGKGIGRGQVFGDPSSPGPFPLILKNATTKSIFLTSITKAHLNTVRNDTVCTHIVIDSLFADNSKGSARTCNLVKISESNRDTQFANRACP